MFVGGVMEKIIDFAEATANAANDMIDAMINNILFKKRKRIRIQRVLG